MAVTTYILSIEDFTNRADITQNLKTEKLKAYLGVVQEKYMPKILCPEQSEALIAQIASGALTVANTALLPFLKDYLIYKTYKRYLVNANALSTVGGIRTQTDTTSDVASDKLMGSLIGQANSDANFYQDTLVNFLKCNKDDYPLWRDSICGCGRIRTRKNNTFSMVGKTIYTDEKINWT